MRLHITALALTALALASLITSGCSATSPRTQKMLDSLDEAGTVGTARHLAHWLQVDLEAQNPAMLAGDCAERLEQLRFEAIELKAEADALALQLELYIESQTLSGESIESMGQRLSERRERLLDSWTEYNRACRDAAY